jgi:hypothetical protein
LKKEIQYNWGEEHLEIDLGNRVERRIKVILGVELCVTVGMATVFLLRAFQVNQGIISFLLCLGACILYILASYRFISRFSFRERIMITSDHFTIIKQTPITRKTFSYDWRHMGTLHYIGKDMRSDYHLKDVCYDYLRFDTQEKFVQDLHHDGNLFFNYKDTSIRFARGIYSWHAEEIVRMIQLYTGSTLKLGAEWKYLIETSEWDME